jgi:hypothetical protein
LSEREMKAERREVVWRSASDGAWGSIGIGGRWGLVAGFYLRGMSSIVPAPNHIVAGWQPLGPSSEGRKQRQQRGPGGGMALAKPTIEWGGVHTS